MVLVLRIIMPCAVKWVAVFLEDPKNHALPHIGVYFAEEDSGHGFFALDYRNINADGEPSVINIYLDNFHEEYIADSFADFVRRLTADE